MSDYTSGDLVLTCGRVSVGQRSEALGLFLAAVACSLPSVGRRLKVQTVAPLSEYVQSLLSTHAFLGLVAGVSSSC